MRFLIACFLLVTGHPVLAQNKQLLYDVQGLPQSLLLNPGGGVDFDLHVGLPFLSQTHIAAGSSGVSLYDIFQESEAPIDENIRDVILGMTNRDFFMLNQQISLLSLGWRIDENKYLSSGIYQETDLFVYFPRDVAVLLFEGNTGAGNKDFDFSEVAATADILNVFHLGLSLDISRDLKIGARGKIYSSIANLRSVGNDGSFIAGRAGGSQPAIKDLDVMVKTSGVIPFLDYREVPPAETAKKFVRKAFFGGNLGLGADLGFTYYFNDRYKLTGSLQDVGFIRHQKSIESYGYSGSFQVPELKEPLLNGVADNAVSDSYKDFEDNFEEDKYYDAYFSTRPAKFNASISYGFGEIYEECNCYRTDGRRRYYNHLGLQIFSVKRPKGLVNAATLSFDRKFSDNFYGKVTYTADSFSLSNVGLLFSARFSHLNFYLAADNLLDYENLSKARNASVQLGVQILIDNS